LGHSEVWGPAGDCLLVVGLTGGIASGKTEVDREFEILGALVVDADQVARDIVLPGTAAYEKIVGRFGEGILDEAGAIDRAALAGVVFADEDKRLLLNSITHPAIFQEMVRLVRERAENLRPGEVPVVILDAALIVDTGVSGVFDLLLVVTADEEQRVHRLLEMRGMTEDEARSRIASQLDESKRMAMADIVIDNNASIEELRSRVREVWGELSRRAFEAYS